ncbi:hypothetical protein [Bowmanella yangjiangensis]|uniref:Lipocalin-like domain-containing protein n=1 Tax=Bowmanella yangjiangensis TaxID=2811230 RepID=A0ABS3CWR5_9ALTE|nr:hypothetical protein [Bowmanella yangjiangensis]MBN7820826.1 hypothetical protein [Bowmanella yangjiangensis]
MIAKTGYLLIAALQLFILSACAATEADIIGEWKLQAVTYADGSVNNVDDGNQVIIFENKIIEQIKGHGRRSYPYTRKGLVLILEPAGEQVEWQILKAETNAMEILTPIGTYNLHRIR